MMIEEAFAEGLRLAREAFAPSIVKGSDVPVLAAYAVFCRAAKGLETDERFDTEAPIFAKSLIIQAFSRVK